MSEEFNKPFCQLTGEDGNVFAVIGRVQRALKKDGQLERATEFAKKAMSGDYTYDEVLQLCHEYVDVH